MAETVDDAGKEEDAPLGADDSIEPIPADTLDDADLMPSKRIALFLQGDRYLDFQALAERIAFRERFTGRQKDTAILELALHLLETRVNELSAKTGKRYVPATLLRAPGTGGKGT
jgi:hypothetical protein